jgi:hypothetical protein
LAKSCQKVSKNSEKGRRRRRRRRRRTRRRRRFVVPRPGPILSHLVKIHFNITLSKKSRAFFSKVKECF